MGQRLHSARIGLYFLVVLVLLLDYNAKLVQTSEYLDVNGNNVLVTVTDHGLSSAREVL